MPKQGKNIYLRKDGRWEGRFVKVRIAGKAQYGYMFGKTYEEVERKLNAISSENTASVPDYDGSVAELANEWLLLRSPQLKASSIAKYTNMLNLYLLPTFGEQEVSVISRSDIIQWSRKLLTSGGAKGKGLAPKTVNSILSLLRNILEFAAKEKYIPIADIRDISVKQPQNPMRILSRAEQQRLSAYLLENLTPCNMGILLCLYTGLRIGEICALTWADILIEEQCLYIHQTMQRVQVKGNAGKKTKVVIMPPKSECSIRRIPIPDEIRQLLITIQKQDEAYLLTGMVHSYVEPRNMENRFKAVTRECDISDVNFHALRHTFATRCVELGFDVKSLSEILGHASVNITMNRYVHPSMELKQKNMNLLSEFLATK